MPFGHRTLRWWIALTCLISGTALAGETDSLPSTAARRSKYEVRGAWLSTVWGLDWPHSSNPRVQMQELREQLDILRENGINTIFLQVRGRGDLLYPSTLEPMHPMLEGCGYDPLAFAIEECHKRGMTVHAWITTLPLEDRRYRRGLKGKGATTFYERHRSETKRHRGKDYMDPTSPVTRRHLAAIAREITERYEVEGIQLDYIRYPDFPDRFPDAKEYREAKTLLPKEEWRRANITRIVEEVHRAVKETDSTVLLSAATIGAYDQIPGAPHIGWTARRDVYQDPVAWERAEAIDFIVPMTYTRGETFAPILRDWAEKLSVPVVIGLGAFRTLKEEGGWPAEQVIDQVAEVQQTEGLSGVCLFRSRQLTERGQGLRGRLSERCFEGRPVLPHAPIIAGDSTLIYPYALSITTTDDRAKISWKGMNGARPCLYAVYASTDSVPDIHSGEALVAVTTSESVEIDLPKVAEGEALFYTLEVSCYDLHTGVEAFVPGGAAIYRKEDPEVSNSAEE